MFYMNLKAGHEFSLVLKSVHVASDLFLKKNIFFLVELTFTVHIGNY